MNNNLKRILNLSKKTGDKVIVVPENEKEEPFVVVPFSIYEENINQFDGGGIDYAELSEKEMFDKVNRDLINWRQSQVDADEVDFADDQDELYNLMKKRTEIQTEEEVEELIPEYDEEEIGDWEDNLDPTGKGDNWQSFGDILSGSTEEAEENDWLDKINQEQDSEDIVSLEPEAKDDEPELPEENEESFAEEDVDLPGEEEPETQSAPEVVYQELDANKVSQVPTIDESFDQEDSEVQSPFPEDKGAVKEKEPTDDDDFSTEPDDLLI